MSTLQKERHSNNLENPLPSRLEVLARLGEAYLVLEAHQVSAQQCVIRIQQLRALLQRVEQETPIQTAGSELEKVMPS
ncbi:MAG: hypothetical protein HY699_11610 [Deltaproteobacteria bacterium]|nr:hypothetical protein [Deltaproteobacteria bacterium]